MADGTVDTSLTANPVGKMFGALGEIAQVQNQVNQNKLFQGQIAAGRALQQSIGPDGQIDFQHANALISQDPATAPFALDAINKLLTGQGQGISNQSAQQRLQAARGDLVRTAIGSLGSNATRAGVLNALNVLAGTGQVDNDFAANIAGNLPPDDSQIGPWAQNNFQLPALGAQGALTATSPAPTAIDSGPQINLVRTPEIGAPSAVGHIDKGLSPEAASTPTPYVDSQGVTHTAPRSAIVTPAGQPKPNQRGITGANGELTTSLAPGEAEAIAAPKVVQAAQVADLGKAFEGSVPRAAQLHELLGSQGDFRSGPGAAKWSARVSEFNRIFGTRFADDAASSQQVFGKIAEQVAEAQRGAMGSAATNAQTEAARIASPNTAYSPEANRRVIALLLGNEDFIQTKQKAWQAAQKHGYRPSDYNSFVTQFNTLYDPRYFAEKYMTPAQKAQMRTELGADASAYDAARRAALSKVWK